MTRRIVFSSRSKFQLEELLEYLEIKFSISTKKKFISKFDTIIEIIRSNPDTFPVSTRNDMLRKCVISKQTTLYYKFNNKEIRLLSIFDTRQNPNKLKDLK